MTAAEKILKGLEQALAHSRVDGRSEFNVSDGGATFEIGECETWGGTA